ncbi:HAD-IA family hydrolase [Candidatus Shapirobacteria bacterium]|nr:HAD-IA family hydrolase [Candidatus Shapirobacteria bacterium]
MIKAVIFDYDETLTKTIEGKAKAYSDFAKSEYNQELTLEAVRKAFGKPYEEFIKTLFGNVEEVNTIISKYQKFSENYPPIAYEDAEENVNRLFTKYLVGIVSGVRRKALFKDLEKLKFDQKSFFHIQCGDDTVDLKPNPKVFTPLLSKLKLCQISPSEVVYVGDSLGDFQVSTAVGFQFIGTAEHTIPKSEFEKVGAEYITEFKQLELVLSGK